MSGGATPIEERQPHPMIRRFARWALDTFFREIEVRGLEHVPDGGPVVFVANHINGLVDPGLLMAFMPRMPRFLAKSTLWRHAVAKHLVRWAAAIPVYRRQDPGVDTSRNAETFAACHKVLAAGGTIALFPEGRSHNEPTLVELKTGVSRIVLQAEEEYGPLGTRLVPVGLTFDDKSRFRSRVLVWIGEPLDPTPEIEKHRTEPSEAVRSLTDRVRAALAQVTLNYPSWREAKLIERAAEIWERPSGELPAERDLGAHFEIRRAFIDGYRELEGSEPERLVDVARAVRDYDELLGLLELRDAQVASSYPPRGVWRFVGRSVERLVVRLPLAIAGTVLSWVPYRLVGWGAERWGHPKDKMATYKVLGSAILYPLFWLAEAGAAAWLGGVWAALAVLILAPVASVVAMRFQERGGHFRREARAYLLLRSQQRSIAELRRLRTEVRAAVAELAEAYLERSRG